MGPALEEVLQPALSTSSHSSSPSEVKEDLVKKLRKKKLQEIQSEEHRQTSLSPGKQQQTGTCKENLAACHVTSPLRAQPDWEPPPATTTTPSIPRAGVLQGCYSSSKEPHPSSSRVARREEEGKHRADSLLLLFVAIRISSRRDPLGLNLS